MMLLTDFMQDPMEARLRAQITALVSQLWHDLRRRQAGKARFLAHRPMHRPATIRAQTESGYLTRRFQPRAFASCFGNVSQV